mmetsp:Transcript_31135/g.38450  ORF Transcript_31135/g.38450 Transcript_31135/m.38450 type:complete len:451 (+) Transcript_31135:222-1574(+)|eukprot:CAMPEP_0204833206 /NCGR_PEP_ID=MMETSP1346-20131115/15988_1 /ASSEMBLY_ACC=CAM_ASM_000771 /TAXON_ID=215587 /ORGANISM="Aplanochytrium stocchinoi, Strain GSBS06" /LENGTH=450 /DNA_ID=CAMNT_0051965531 /DNA_START=168 /DNA_END=1520 /DNA_ORIENTATION=+
MATGVVLDVEKINVNENINDENICQPLISEEAKTFEPHTRGYTREVAIVGSHRSGKTLLELLKGWVPDVIMSKKENNTYFFIEKDFVVRFYEPKTLLSHLNEVGEFKPYRLLFVLSATECGIDSKNTVPCTGIGNINYHDQSLSELIDIGRHSRLKAKFIKVLFTDRELFKQHLDAKMLLSESELSDYYFSRLTSTFMQLLKPMRLLTSNYYDVDSTCLQELERSVKHCILKLPETSQNIDNVLVDVDYETSGIDFAKYAPNVANPQHIKKLMKTVVQNEYSNMKGKVIPPLKPTKPCEYNPELVLLNIQGRSKLIKYIDGVYDCLKLDDVKLPISRYILERILGPKDKLDLFQFSDTLTGKIKYFLSRNQGLGCNFHRDTSKCVIQVPLNGDDQYKGGRLLYTRDDGTLEYIPRTAGTVIKHDDSVVHAVTHTLHGVRYALFILHDNAD